MISHHVNIFLNIAGTFPVATYTQHFLVATSRSKCQATILLDVATTGSKHHVVFVQLPDAKLDVSKLLYFGFVPTHSALL